MSVSNLLVRRLAGAILGGVAIATVFSLLGYSDVGPTRSNYLRELAIALASYLVAAFIVEWLIKRDNAIFDTLFVSLLGSALSFPVKLIFLEGRNGIPVYIAETARNGFLKPFVDLSFHAISFVILATLLSLPFVAAGVGMCRFYAKKGMRTTARL
ncbi:MAG TPA: hypothetical protein VF088_03265 [Pyrinomonadaceae bacterium]